MNKSIISVITFSLIFITQLIPKYLNAQCHIDDWDGLKGIFESTNIQNKNLTGWNYLFENRNSPPNNCDLGALSEVSLNNNSRVRLLNLSRKNLSGSIPSSIGNLVEIEILYLGDNTLSGSIPPSIGNLVNVVNLSFYNNQLSGAIPSTIGNLINADYIHFGENQLTTIPPEIGELTNLTRLFIFDNQLSGNIPPEIGYLTNLEILGLYNNQLSGSLPSEIANLSNLWVMELSNNLLGGNIPTEIGNLNNLQLLDLSHNQFSGSIPVEVSNLVSLSGLVLSHNQLSGEIPLEIYDLINLGSLDLSHNQLSGIITPQIGNLNFLYTLNLGHNLLTGGIPLGMVDIINHGFETLFNIDISHNQLTSCYPNGFADKLCLDEYDFFPEFYRHIDEGNNFDATWEDFCNTGAGGCSTSCAITNFDVTGMTDSDVAYTLNFTGNPSYYVLQTKQCSLSFSQDNSNCPPDLWTEIPDAFELPLFEPCQTYSFRMLMVCEGDTLYSEEVEYYFDDGTCPSCDYNSWIWDEWFMQQDCDDCPFNVELIEFDGNQYIAVWETTSPQVACYDFLSEVFNCDGTTFCYQGGFAGFNECGDAGLLANYTVLETIYSYNDTCLTCDYESWLWDAWFMQQDCDDCPFNVELIEFNGSQYIAVWETLSLETGCDDFLSIVYNCDGTSFCNQGGFAGFNECSDAGLSHNYTILETIYSYNDACITCTNSCSCSLPPDPGVCYSENVQRWYFDESTNTCQQFYYSGCGGNSNNFESYEVCIQNCQPRTCDYDSWLWDKWFMQQGCDDYCPFIVELIEFNGNQYISFWEATSPQFACADFLNEVFNCDGTTFCYQGGEAGFEGCSDAGLLGNFTVLETIYNYNDACLCPAILNLGSNTLNGGIYHASENIMYAGQMGQGVNVVLKAGQSVQLTSGFSTRGSNSFKAKIEACE